MMKVRFQCPGCGVSLAKDHLTPNKSVRCPKCGKHFLPAAQGRPPNGPPARPLPLAVPVAAAAPPAPRSKTGLVGCLVVVFGGLMLLGMAAAGGAVYWVMRGQPAPDPVVMGPGTTEPVTPPPTGTGGMPPGTGHEKSGDGNGPGPGPGSDPGKGPGNRPAPEPFGPPVEVTLLDKGGGDEPGPGPAAAGVLKALKGRVQRVAYAPDGTKLAAVYPYTENGGGKTQVVLWDLASQEPTTLLDASGPGLVFFSADGKTLITGSGEQAGTYDVATGRGKATLPGELVTASADGRTLVTMDRQNRYSVYDVPSGKEALSFEEASGGSHVAVSPDGKTVAVDARQEVRLFDVPAGKELPRFKATPSNDVAALFFTDATHLLVGVGPDRRSTSIALWDVGDRNGPAQLRQRADEHAWRPVLSPDGKTLTLDIEGGSKVGLWDISAWKLRASFPGGSAAAFSADSKTIAAYANAGVAVADAATGQVRKVVPGQRTTGGDYEWSSFGLSPDGQMLALGTTEGAIHLRPVGGGSPAGVKEIASLPFPEKTGQGHGGEAVGGDANDPLFFTPDGRFVVVPAWVPVDANTGWNHVAFNLTDRTFSAGFNAISLPALLDARTVYTTSGYTELFTDLATGKTRERKPEKPVPRYPHLLLSPDGKTLAADLTAYATGKNEQIALVNPANGQIMTVLQDNASASRFAFSPDGKFLAACVDRGALNVKLWDLTSKAEVPTVAEHARDYLAFADNGKWLVTVGDDVLHAYETNPAQTEKKVELRRGHTGQVIAVACSPTAPLFASVGANGEALLRDLTTGDVRVRLPGHTGNVTAVGFTPDGKRLVTAGADKLLKVWEIGDLPPPGEAAKPVLPGPARPRQARAFPFQVHKYAEFDCEKPGEYRGYLRFSRDGNLVAAGYRQFQVWDLLKKSLEYPTAGGSDPRASSEAWLSPDGRHLMYTATDNRDPAWWLATTDVTTGTVRQDLVSKRFTGALAFSPDDKTVAVGNDSPGAKGKVLTVLNLPSFEEKAALTAFDASVTALGYTPDDAELFAFIKDREGTRLLRLDPETLKQRADLGKVDSTTLVFSPDSKLIGFYATKKDRPSNESTPLTLWDIAAGKERTTVKNVGDTWSFVAGAGLLAMSRSYDDFRVSDINTGQLRKTIACYNEMKKDAGHENDPVYGPGSYDLAFSPDGHWLAMGALSGQVYLWDVLRGKLVAKFQAHTGGVNGLAFSPDGRFLVTIGEEKKLKVWYLERLDNAPPAAPQQPPAPAPEPAPVPPEAKPPMSAQPGPAPAPSPPGGVGPLTPKDAGPDVVSVGELATGVQSLAYSPDGKRLAAFAVDQVVKLFNLETKKFIELGKPAGLGKPPVTTGAVFTPDGKLLAAAAGDKVVLYDADGKEVKQLDHGDWVVCVATAPKATVLAVAAGTKVTLWDTATWAKKQELDAGSDVSCVAVTPDGSRVFAGAAGLFVWDTATGEKKFERPWPDDVRTGQQVKGRAVSMAFAPEGKLLVLAIDRGQASTLPPVLVDVASATAFQIDKFKLAFWDYRNLAVAFAPGGLLAVSSREIYGKEQRLTLWDLRNQREVARRALPAGTYPGLAFAPDGKTLAYGGDTKAIHLWSLANTLSPPEPVAVLGQGYEINAVAFSPDSRMLAAAGKGANDAGELKLWDVKTLDAVAVVEKAAADVKPFTGVAFTPDGKTLAAAGGMKGRAVHFWDPTARKLLSTWTGPAEDDFRPAKVVFSPDGQLWAAAGVCYNPVARGDYGTVFVVERGKEKSPRKIEAKAAVVAISPDKTLVAVFDGAPDSFGDVTPYAAASGQAQAALFKSAFAMAASPDSARLAVAVYKDRVHTVKLFDFATGKEEKQFTAPWAPETDKLGAGRAVAGAVAVNDRSVALAVIENQGPREMLSLMVWDRATGKLRRSVRTEAELWLHVTSLALSPHNKLLAVGGHYYEKRGVSHYTGKVTLWKVEE